MKSFDRPLSVGNEEAQRLFQSDKEAFLLNVQNTVKDSLNRVYEQKDPECTIRFSEPIPAHSIIRDSILGSKTEQELVGAAADSNKATKKLPFYDASNEVR